MCVCDLRGYLDVKGIMKAYQMMGESLTQVTTTLTLTLTTMHIGRGPEDAR